MKKLLLFSVFALMVVSFSAGAFAQDGATKMMKKTDTGVELVGTAVMTAKVQALNVEDRLIVLADSAGNVQVVEAGPEVKNFDQIAVGDQVTAEFYESVAFQLSPPDAEPAAGELVDIELQVCLAEPVGQRGEIREIGQQIRVGGLGFQP